MKKQTKKVTKKHESGRSMIEMVGVLAVMGLITAAAFVLITSALRSQRLTRVNDDVAAIAAGVRLVHGNKADFSGVDGNELALIGYSNVKTPFNTDYTVKKNSGDTTKFDIEFNVDTATTCSALGTSLSGSNGCTAKCSSSNTIHTVAVSCAKYVND